MFSQTSSHLSGYPLWPWLHYRLGYDIRQAFCPFYCVILLSSLSGQFSVVAIM